MNCTEVQARLNDYLDGGLPADEKQAVELHLQQCSDCRKELNSFRSVLSQAAALPRSITPSHDLWPGIEGRIAQRQPLLGRWKRALWLRRDGGASRDDVGLKSLFDFRRSPSWVVRLAPVGIAIVIVVGAFWLATKSSGPSWDVARVEGAPRVGSTLISETGKLRVGDWLVTDNASRAKIDVGLIGKVEVQPNTRIRLLQATATDHRLGLDRGTIHASIWAPPRLFFVETPSATAIDLGCEYVLHVDEHGAGVLQVTAGWVSLERQGRESIIPAGAMCLTRPGIGPGTPFQEDASERFREALSKYDFEYGGSRALETVLAEARNMDSITLWHLFFRVEAHERARVYDRLAALVPPPQGVTRDGMLQGNDEMIKAWQNHLNLGMKPWWKFWQ
jgi:hypothetical protein